MTNIYQSIIGNLYEIVIENLYEIAYFDSCNQLSFLGL